ncbi:MAG: hypothetical protein AAF658_00160 [Myxococcota bacterium]
MNEHRTTPSAALIELSRWTESVLEQDEELREVEIDERLRDKDGSIGKREVTLHTKRFAGRGLSSLFYAKIVDSDRCQRSLTLIGLPEPDSELPILGIDLIAFGNSLSLVALDLAPTRFAYRHQNARPLLSRLVSQTAELKTRKIPDFTRGAFSDLAIIAGAPRGTEDIAMQAARDILECYLLLPRGEDSSTYGTRSSKDRDVQHWCAAELNNRKEHNALAGVFGATFARSYLDFLFQHEARREAA